MARVTSNIDLKVKQIKKLAKKLSKKTLYQTIAVALEEIGNTSVVDFMIPKSVESAIADASDDKKISIRSGRLAGSIVGAFRFSKSDLPRSVERFRSKKFSWSEAGFGEGKKESIRQVKVTGSKWQGVIGSKVPYAVIQEKGGTLHPTVTDRARGFFWGMYNETREDMWRRMAMSSAERFTTTIRARPFLKPAGEKARPKILKIFHAAVHGKIKNERI
jgi:phage gpG-like protein